MGLLDQFGKSVTRGPGVKAGIDKHLSVEADVFEGIVRIQIYEDAISGKGKCSHCNGPVEGVLRFPKGYSLVSSADRVERQQDAKMQLYDKFKREHQCGSRLHKNKIDVDVFLKRFE